MKVQFTLEQGMKAQKGSKGIALLFLQPCYQMEWVVSATPQPLYPGEREPVPIVQGDGWALWPVQTGMENLTPHRDSNPGPSNP